MYAASETHATMLQSPMAATAWRNKSTTVLRRGALWVDIVSAPVTNPLTIGQLLAVKEIAMVLVVALTTQ